MKILTGVVLAPHTTIRIGGPAESFTEVTTREELLAAAQWARQRSRPLRLLGNGSNTLISDAGVKGLVVRNLTDQIEVLAPGRDAPGPVVRPRFELIEPDPGLEALSYDESAYPPVWVTLASGAYLPRVIFTLIAGGITGLEWFAGIPATVGGASYINLHGADRYWSDYLVGAEILTPAGEVKTVAADYFQYGYDDSVLKQNRDLVLSATFRLRRGPAPQALKIAKYWQLKKAHQPQRSLGCIFQNLSRSDQERLGLPVPSVGYLIDKKLGLKGTRVGRAAIARQHAGFIVNLGGAKFDDVLQLIGLIRQRAGKELGLELALEIVIWPD